MGLRGLSWASSGPMRGVAGVVQPAGVVTNLQNGPTDTRRVVWAVVVNKTEKKIKKNTPRAQTMCLASFGPLFLFVACVGLLGCCGPLWAS